MIQKALRVAFFLAISLFLITAGFIWFAHSKLHNSDIPSFDYLPDAKQGLRIMTFFPHPDDEVTVSGTLLAMKAKWNAEILLVCLTRGEAGPTGGLVAQSELGEKRSLELAKVSEILGAKHLELLDYPDSGIKGLGLDSLKTIAAAMVAKFQPDIILSYDSRVGLYGSDDHRLCGLAMEEYFLENSSQPGFPAKKLYQVTLSPKQIEVALAISPGFQTKYPLEEGKGLPKPDFSIKTQAYFPKVLTIMEAHETQRSVFQDLMPYHDKIPAFIYSRIFDREYFHEVKPK